MRVAQDRPAVRLGGCNPIEGHELFYITDAPEALDLEGTETLDKNGRLRHIMVPSGIVVAQIANYANAVQFYCCKHPDDWDEYVRPEVPRYRHTHI